MRTKQVTKCVEALQKLSVGDLSVACFHVTSPFACSDYIKFR